jgi:hypothetical protein
MLVGAPGVTNLDHVPAKVDRSHFTSDHYSPPYQFPDAVHDMGHVQIAGRDFGQPGREERVILPAEG